MQSLASVTRAGVDRSGAWSRRVGGFAALPGLLAAHGVAPVRVLSASGLSPDALSLPGRKVGFAESARALGEAVRATRCEHFGLLAGGQTRLADLGHLGAMMLGAPALGPALRSLAAHHHHVCTGGVVLLQERARTVSLGYAVFHPDVDHLAPALDFAAAAGLTFIRELCGHTWNPIEVLLPRRRPADPGPYQAFFRCPVRFDAEWCELRFPARAMQQRLLPTTTCGYPALAVSEEQLMDDQLLPQLYRTTRMLLLQGLAHGDQMAHALGLNRRTLARRLAAQGQSLQRVLDEVRYAVARELLADTDLSVVGIALTLGYAEASPFVRAFRRWSGSAPLIWRQAHRAEALANDYAGRASAASLRRA